jgi:hypothetical protein
MMRRATGSSCEREARTFSSVTRRSSQRGTRSSMKETAVSFDVVEGPKGLQAKNVVKIS